MLHYIKSEHPTNKNWVVFIHGAGGSIETWKYQMEHMTASSYLAIDLRDHGASKNILPSFQSYNFDIITEDIMNVLAHEGIHKASFVTLSFGSVLLQAFSLKYPSVVQSAVIAGGIFKGNILIKSFVHTARFLNLFLSYPTMYKTFSFLLMPKKRNQVARRIYQMQARKISQEEYLKWIDLYGEFFRLLKTFFHQDVPFRTLIIMGGDDYIFLKAAQAFSAKRDNVSLEVLPKVGHICNIEQHAKFNQLAQQFLFR